MCTVVSFAEKRTEGGWRDEPLVMVVTLSTGPLGIRLLQISKKYIVKCNQLGSLNTHTRISSCNQFPLSRLTLVYPSEELSLQCWNQVFSFVCSYWRGHNLHKGPCPPSAFLTVTLLLPTQDLASDSHISPGCNLSPYPVSFLTHS